MLSESNQTNKSLPQSHPAISKHKTGEMNCLRPILKYFNDERRSDAESNTEDQLEEHSHHAVVSATMEQPAVQFSSTNADKLALEQPTPSAPVHKILEEESKKSESDIGRNIFNQTDCCESTSPASPSSSIKNSFIRSKENGLLSGCDIIIPEKPGIKNQEDEDRRIYNVLIGSFSKLFLETKVDTIATRGNTRRSDNPIFDEKLQDEELSSDGSFSYTTNESASC